MAIALGAARSFAGENDTEDVQQASYSTARQGRSVSAPHRVTIWRGGTPKLAAAQYEDDQAEMPPMPPNAPDGYTPSQIGPSSDPGTPFLDETSGGSYEGGSYGGGSCGSGPCGCGQSACPTCCDMCMPPWWAHRTFIFGQYLYLNPNGVDMAYAIQQNGTGGSGTTPEGRVGVVDQNWNSAYAAGFGVALSPCASVQASYTNFHSHAVDSLASPNITNGTVASLVFHPESLNEGSTSSLVNAANDIDYQLADVEYRRLLTAGERFALNYSVGGRYAKLNQDFASLGNFSPPTGTILTTTNINFQGGGLKVGLDGMQRLGRTRFGLYSKGFLSLIFGQFDSNYLQYDQTTASVQAASNWSNTRVVPILEYEVGLNFTSYNGRWRWSSGYYTAFWFNTVATPQYVQAVQNADFVNLGQTIAFDGLVSRLEYRY